ncbi:unnamed protein product [Adineta steineri]|uniref:Secreted protein n=1 Tax=Adineta steineri TaxID=433720 RepID=A0A819HHU2_9BILA|nr:unnamed protein product [Adineta steineri]CAF3903995.1 unnamed protein product [Adineta steineri]
MFTPIGPCFILIVIIHINIINYTSATTTNIEDQDEKRSSIAASELFDADPLYDNDDEDDDVNNDAMHYQKRNLRKKWAEFFQRPNSPYAIAFPALLRSRR